jgi:hypothetical protein
MKRVIRYAAVAILPICVLAACSDPAAKLAATQPATGEQLREFSRKWNDKVDVRKVAALLQRFCVNTSGAPCEPDTTDRLRRYGLTDDSIGIDLAHSFITMAADARDGTVDQNASDENYIYTSYRAMLGRDPDPEGAAHHLGTITGRGEEARKALATAFLKSPEFNSQK